MSVKKLVQSVHQVLATTTAEKTDCKHIEQSCERFCSNRTRDLMHYTAVRVAAQSHTKKWVTAARSESTLHASTSCANSSCNLGNTKPYLTVQIHALSTHVLAIRTTTHREIRMLRSPMYRADSSSNTRKRLLVWQSFKEVSTDMK